MIHLPFLLAALTLGFQAPPDAKAKAKVETWATVGPDDGSFTVEMPATPEQILDRPPGPKGPLEHVMLHCRYGGVTYNAQRIHDVEPPASGKEREALDEQQKGLERKSQSKRLKQEDVKIDKWSGRDFTTEGPAPPPFKGRVTSRTRIVFADKSFYFLTALSSPDRPLPPEADRFFNSFKFGKPGAAPPKIEVADATPEEAWLTFLVAMRTQDETALRAVTLPSKDFAILLAGDAMPKSQARRIRDDFARQPLRRLKAGEVITVPGKGQMTLTEAETAGNRAVLLPDGAPLPTRCQKVDGRWKVDASPIIAARLAAEAARKKNEGR